MLSCVLHFVMPLPSAGTIPRQHKLIHVQGVLVLKCSVPFPGVALSEMVQRFDLAEN